LLLAFLAPPVLLKGSDPKLAQDGGSRTSRATSWCPGTPSWCPGTPLAGGPCYNRRQS
jgi:hypothetical protein